MKNVVGVVYKVVNKINNKIYIGQTIQFLDHRRNGHISCALLKKDNIYFHNAIRKYGPENFEWCVIAECHSLDDLYLLEMEAIKKFNSFTEGYNSDFGGKGKIGFKHSEESKNKISVGNKGQRRTNITRRKISNALKGKPKSEIHRKKLSLSKIGKKRSEECIKNTIYGISKNYKITTPKGEIIFVRGLKQFCRTYKEEDLCDSTLIKVAKGKLHQHKGYVCEYMEDVINEL